MAVGAFFYSKYVRNVPVVIPFEVIRNSILFNVEIEGETYTFQFDTGAANMISPRLKEKLKLKPNGNHFITDFYGNSSTVNSTLLPNLKLGNISSTNVKVGVLKPIQNFWFCDIELDGYLGLEFFKGKVVKIDLENKKLTVASDISYLQENFGSPLKISYLSGLRQPYIPINFSPSSTADTVLFDTGAINDLIRIEKNSFHKMMNDRSLNNKSVKDTLKISLGAGVVGKQRDTINYSFKLSELTISNTKFKNLIVETFDSNKSILGPKILAKAVVVLDLVKNDFYIKPYDNSVLDYSFRLDFQFHNSEVVEVSDSSKAYQAGVRLGHVLKTANNIKLDSLSKCDQLKIDWQEFYLQKNIEFVFESEDGEIVYNYEAPDIVAQQ